MSTLLDLDSILDESLEAVEAAPEFVTPDTGNYRLRLKDVKTNVREAKDKDAAIAEGKPTSWGQLKFIYVVEEVYSVEGEGLPVMAGSLFSEDFNLTEQGKPYMKARIQDLTEASGGSKEDADALTLRDVITQFPQADIVFDCHIRTTTTKFDDGGEWTSSRVSQVKATA